MNGTYWVFEIDCTLNLRLFYHLLTISTSVFGFLSSLGSMAVFALTTNLIGIPDSLKHKSVLLSLSPKSANRKGVTIKVSIP